MTTQQLEKTTATTSYEHEPSKDAKIVNDAIGMLNDWNLEFNSRVNQYNAGQSVEGLKVPSAAELLNQARSHPSDRELPPFGAPADMRNIIYLQVEPNKLKLLPLEQRIVYTGLLFDMTECAQGVDPLNTDPLEGTLEEIVFTTRDMIVHDVDFDDIEILGSGNGSRNAMLLYLATEHAYAGDYDTAGEIIHEIESTAPHIANFLKTRLSEAREYSDDRKISPELSLANLKRSNLSQADSPEWRAKAKDTEFALTIGVTTDTAKHIFDDYGGLGRGRLLTALEFSTSGGSSEVNSPNRNGQYNALRKTTAEEQLGYKGNLFLPPLVYGALSPENRPDKANSYGEIALHIRQRDDVSYSIGDSIPFGIKTNVHKTRVNIEEAKPAAVFNETTRHKLVYKSEVGYVEAQIPGATLDDIEKVSVDVRGPGPNYPNASKIIEAAQAALRAGLPVTISFWWSPRPISSFKSDDASLSLGNSIRSRLDPSGELWDMIAVRVVDILPRKLSQDEIVRHYQGQDMQVVYYSDLEDIAMKANL